MIGLLEAEPADEPLELGRKRLTQLAARRDLDREVAAGHRLGGAGHLAQVRDHLAERAGRRPISSPLLASTFWSSSRRLIPRAASSIRFAPPTMPRLMTSATPMSRRATAIAKAIVMSRVWEYEDSAFFVNASASSSLAVSTRGGHGGQPRGRYRQA